MSKKEAIEATEATPKPAEITLVEFCSRLSETVRRPELIGAFEHASKAAGKFKASAEDFAADFEKFRNKPV